jgi:hypothetical protein
MEAISAEIDEGLFGDLTTMTNVISRIEAYNHLMARTQLQGLDFANYLQGHSCDLIMTCTQDMLRTKHSVHGFLRTIRDAVEPARQFIDGRVRDSMSVHVPVGAYLPHMSAFDLHSTPNEVVQHAVTHPRNFNTRRIYEQARGLPWSALIETIRRCTEAAHKLLAECNALIAFSRTQHEGCTKAYVFVQMVTLDELVAEFSRNMGRYAGYLEVCLRGWGRKFREVFNSHLYLEAVDDLTGFTAMQE